MLGSNTPLTDCAAIQFTLPATDIDMVARRAKRRYIPGKFRMKLCYQL